MVEMRCKVCQVVIEKSKFLVSHGPVSQVLLQEYCAACGFLEGFRRNALCARPFRLPLRRPTREGQPPILDMLRFAEWKATCPAEPNDEVSR